MDTELAFCLKHVLCAVANRVLDDSGGLYKSYDVILVHANGHTGDKKKMLKIENIKVPVDNDNNDNLKLKLLHISTINISSVELLLQLFKNICTLYTLSCGNVTCSKPQRMTPQMGMEQGTPRPKV